MKFKIIFLAVLFMLAPLTALVAQVGGLAAYSDYLRRFYVFDHGEKKMVEEQKVKSFNEVINCYRITGNENIVMEVVLDNQKHLEMFIDQLITYGETKTQIILSNVIENNPISRL